MDIIENLAHWSSTFQNGWLAHYQQTGKIDWKLYVRPKNKSAPAGPGLDLSKSRLMLISTAGGYLAGSQAPFDAANDLGDYSIRLFPSSTPFEALAYAHTHYDHQAVETDPQVLLPLRHLEDLVSEGLIGQLAPSVVSFNGYQPDVARVLDEIIPPILEVAQAEKVDAVLLVPA